MSRFCLQHSALFWAPTVRPLTLLSLVLDHCCSHGSRSLHVVTGSHCLSHLPWPVAPFARVCYSFLLELHLLVSSVALTVVTPRGLSSSTWSLEVSDLRPGAGPHSPFSPGLSFRLTSSSTMLEKLSMIEGEIKICLDILEMKERLSHRLSLKGWLK